MPCTGQTDSDPIRTVLCAFITSEILRRMVWQRTEQRGDCFNTNKILIGTFSHYVYNFTITHSSNKLKAYISI